MPDRELLKEARDALESFHDCKEGLLERIDEHLSNTGKTTAAEIVRKIRKEPFDEYSDLVPKGCNAYAITDTEATALIESYAAAEVIRLRKWQDDAFCHVEISRNYLSTELKTMKDDSSDITDHLKQLKDEADRLIAEVQEVKE